MTRPEDGALRRLLGVTLAAFILSFTSGNARANKLQEAETEERATAVQSRGEALQPVVRVRELGGVQVGDAALLLSGQSGGNLSGAVLWCAEPGVDEEGRISTHLHVELDGEALLDGAPPKKVPVVIAAYATDEQGTVVGSLSIGVLVEGAGLRAALAPAGLRFVGQLALPPGSFSMRVMARIHGAERFLLTREELRLAPAEAGDAAVSAPLFTTPENAWLEVRQPGLHAFSGCVSGLAPAAKPVLDVTRPTRFVAIASGWPEGARLHASVADTHGRILAQPKLSIDGTSPAGGGSTEIIEIAMQAVDVPRGEYLLTLQVLTDTFQTVTARGLHAVLVRGEGPAAWASLDEPTDVAPIRSQVSSGAADESSEQQMRSAYAAALSMMVEGEVMAARRAVADLERRVRAADPAEGLAKLRKAELRVAVKLEDEDPQSLPALLVLHRDLCHTYSAFRENVLARHSAIVTAKLAEMVGTIKGRPPVDDLAEAALVSVAMDLVQSNDYVAGGRLLERTLELDSKSIPALENLAALRERTGHRDEAVELLKRLVAVDPDNQEARLRLGVNLRRTKRLGAARKTLRPLLEGSAPEWIRSIAAQELAHLLVESANLDQAEQLLAGTIDGAADQQTLAIQLSWTRDLAGRAAEATATLARLEQDVGRQEDSARRRYCRWPSLSTHGIGHALNLAAEERVPELRRALASSGLR